MNRPTVRPALIAEAAEAAARIVGGLVATAKAGLQKASVDHLVGARDQRSWKGEAEGFGRFEIDDHSKFRGQLDR
jgi:hypothetical protein